MIEINAAETSLRHDRETMHAATASSPPRIKDILLPKEHGSWSLALEPIALGLIAAGSIPGAVLAAGAFAGFLMRRPLQLATAPTRDGRTGTARLVAAALAVIAGTCVFAAGSVAGFVSLLPLAAAAPTALLFWMFDRKKEARAVEAEIAGAATFAVLPAAIATLAGNDYDVALLLAAAALARSIPTILTIRAYLRINKGTPASRTPSVLLSLLPSVFFTVIYLAGDVPIAMPILSTLLLARTLILLSPRFPRLPASRIGMAEAILGLVYVIAAGIALG